jgi:CYTH domain-containing protein
MNIEIERKFLVKSLDFKTESFDKKHIKQGYLNSDKNRTVRIRVADTRAFITIKGKSNKNGTSRFEWEKEIHVSEAEELLLLCEPNIVEKIRYLIQVGKHIFEVDEFAGNNQGLVVAEIELSSEEEAFEKPNWLSKEVTGDLKYYNSNISKLPFTSWK